MQEELENYKAAAGYIAFFLEQRSRFGDMDTAAGFDEFKGNVCTIMRGGFDILGTQ
jgi:hypothetical protein